MIFWEEKNIQVSYEELLFEIKKKQTKYRLEGYRYFFDILLNLLDDYQFESHSDIIKYITKNANQLSFIINTSGTTSAPKDVKVNLSNCIRYVKKNDGSKKRVWGLGYPVGSFASTQVFFQSFLNKETIIYIFNTDFKNIEHQVKKSRVTNLCCTPTFLSMILINMNSKNYFLEKLTTGGEKIKNNLISSFKQKFVNAEYINVYATTETGSLLYSKSEYFTIPSKYNGLVKIEKNSLLVHESILNDSEKIKLEDGWYDTNDIIKFIDSDKFKFIARKNGYINSGGYRIEPGEIEDEINKISGVVDVHVYGKPNSILGTIICADIVGKNLDSKSIKSSLRQKIDKHKIPQVVKIVKYFDHTNMGKKQIII
ncbi:AMP-binding protein [Candidatus Marinimicrobia bacterium]|nr:AMP-binding protein [Candidatus Neomarinimicrobiota bacterium]